MKENMVTILCSGFGLGFYIPGLIIRYQLQNAGMKADVDVFERYLLENKRENIDHSKKAYHNDFSIALTAQKIPIDIRNSIDPIAVEQLINRWKRENRHHFIVMSGHWIYILDEYRKRMAPDEIFADLLYVDTDLSPSWKGIKKHNPHYNEAYRDVWMFRAEAGEAGFYLSVCDQSPIPFSDRENRLLVHGGGWGMGTYQSKIPKLESAGFNLDIVAYQPEDIIEFKEGNRFYMNAPGWSAWEKNESGEYEFPLFSEVTKTAIPVYANRKDYHMLYDVTRKDKAIIAKPGAGTIMDSFASATPLIILEPFGPHEQKNADLWIQKGFGIPFAQWEEMQYSLEPLERIHNTIWKARKDQTEYRNYVKDYIERFQCVELIRKVMV